LGKKRGKSLSIQAATSVPLVNSSPIRRVIRRLFLVGAAAGLLPCLVILAAGWLNRFSPLADAFSQFRLHATAGVIICGLVLCILRARKSAVLALTLSAIGVASMWPWVPFLSPSQEAQQATRLVQFNTFLRNQIPDVSVNWIKAQNPDFVTLQEVSRQTQKIFDGLAPGYQARLECQYTTGYRTAVMSRFPKLAEKCLAGKGLAWMQVDMNGKPVTIAALHLSWPYPYRQWQQIEDLASEFKAMPRPVIMAGDFNAAPWSDTLRRVAEWTDAQVAPGLRLTWRVGPHYRHFLPFLPIDHVLLPGGTAISQINAGPLIGSDHSPVFAAFTLPDAPAN
jgi:endonuclease/exonuclease/phosphatase (EEP) superfamily protein YafD